MDYTFILGYWVLLLIQYFTIQAIPITLVGGIISKFTNIYVVVLIAGIVFLVNILSFALKVLHFDFSTTN